VKSAAEPQLGAIIGAIAGGGKRSSHRSRKPAEPQAPEGVAMQRGKAATMPIETRLNLPYTGTRNGDRAFTQLILRMAAQRLAAL